MQVQSIKQANSVLKRSLADGVDAVRPTEVSCFYTLYFYIFLYLIIQ